MERIPVTHAGSLIRPAELLSFLSAIERGLPYDENAYASTLRNAVSYVVGRQVDAGIDVVDDGEMGKSNWISYLYERMSGLQSRPMEQGLATILPPSRDRQAFPGAYATLDALDAAAARASNMAGWVCTGPLSYDRGPIERDLANFKAALAEAGRDASTAFLPVVAPASAYWLANEYYKTDEEFVYALAGVLHEEYSAIVESGMFLQVDDAVLMHEADTMLSRGQSWADYRRWARLRVEALNHALRGLPEDRIRYHICFGSWHGPHAFDPPLRDSIDLVLRVRARYYLMEQANPRHEHEEIQWAKLAALAEGARIASRELWGAKAEV